MFPRAICTHSIAGLLSVPDIANYIYPLIPLTAEMVLPGRRISLGNKARKRRKSTQRARGLGLAKARNLSQQGGVKPPE